MRAGAGSARDTLSVLDQLLGGAGPDGVTYALATGLLGYTPDTLLDEVVDAFAAGDGAAVFGVVDKVIETGQDPRRFTEDLLRRLRDLVIVAAVPDAPATGLIDVSEDQAERLVAQAARFGQAELSRAADIVATGLTEMRGATAPRLLLELICARVLLPGRRPRHRRACWPGSTGSSSGPSISGGAPSAAPPAAGAAAGRAAQHPVEPVAEASAPRRARRAAPSPPAPSPPPSEPPAEPAAGPRRAEPAPEPAAGARAAPPAAPPAPAALTLVDVRRLWPDIVEATKLRRRVTWIHLTQNAQVIGGRRQHPDPRLRQRRRPRLLRQRRQRGDPAPGRDRRGRRRLADRDHRRPGRQPAGAAAAAAAAARRRRRAADGPRTARLTPPAERRRAPGGRAGRPEPPGRAAAPTPSIAAARGAIARPGRPTSAAPDDRPTPTPTPTRRPRRRRPAASTAPSCSQRELGAQIIEEIPHE